MWLYSAARRDLFHSLIWMPIGEPAAVN